MIKRLHSNLFYASNLENTFEFYKKLGFEPQKSNDGVRVKLGDFTLAFIDENTTAIQNESGKTPKGLGIYTYVEVDDVDQYFEFVKKSDVEPRTEPKTWSWGKREFVVKDPDGYKLVFYSPVK
ncbi:MAG: VOC family protein [Patescibacteria group bacterium]